MGCRGVWNGFWFWFESGAGAAANAETGACEVCGVANDEVGAVEGWKADCRVLNALLVFDVVNGEDADAG